jgi:signal transduction histidine kinase
VSCVLLIGYLYNAPFLYGSTIIPVALPAAICFSLLSIILLSTFDYKFWTFNLIKGNKITIQLLKSFLPIVIILTIFSGFLNNAFSINHMNPPFISAVILLISVSITIYVVIVISTKVGSQLLMAEQSLKEIEKQLLKLNSDKDRFISILGHDLKSPFNNLLGLSELLTKNIHKYDIDKIENFATNIHESAQHSFNLLDNLLKWARAQQGNSPFKPQHLNLTDICKDALITLYPLAKTKNIVINCFTEDHLNVFADSDMLKTVLRNLVSNAIKYTNDGGTININAEEDSENVTISVSDNGIGIPPENLAKLFDISEVLTTKGTAKETGTGLGLMLCKEFVEKNGGKIWVESEAGKGSDFRFTMPIFTEQTININT